MIEKRNLSSHAYNQDIAVALVATIIQNYYPAFLLMKKEMQNHLKQRHD